MTLAEALKENKEHDIKVGACDGHSFIYAGKAKYKAVKILRPYLEREVVNTYPSEYGGQIIIFKGAENGKFWTVEEYEGKQPEPINAEALRDYACEDLVNAIYTGAADDLIWGLITGNKKLIGKNEKFLTGGMYGVDPNFGQALIEKARKETAIAKKFVEDFIESGLNKQIIPPYEVATSIVKLIVKNKKVLGVRQKDNKLYIIRKEG